MTDLEKQLHEELGFIVSGVQVQFIVFIEDERHTRAVMPARQTDIQMWSLLLAKQREVLDLTIELAFTKKSLDEAVAELGKRKEFPRV